MATPGQVEYGQLKGMPADFYDAGPGPDAEFSPGPGDCGDGFGVGPDLGSLFDVPSDGMVEWFDPGPDVTGADPPPPADLDAYPTLRVTAHLRTPTREQPVGVVGNAFGDRFELCAEKHQAGMLHVSDLATGMGLVIPVTEAPDGQWWVPPDYPTVTVPEGMIEQALNESGEANAPGTLAHALEIVPQVMAIDTDDAIRSRGGDPSYRPDYTQLPYSGAMFPGEVGIITKQRA